MKNLGLKAAAKLSMSTAKHSTGLFSTFWAYQPKVPAKLQETKKRK